jgi:hypothetical protein
MKFKKLAAAVMVASLMSSTALAHTNSIGYVGDGNGGLNFWYGSWHDGTTFNEAEIKIEGTDASGNTITFSDGNGGTQTYSIDEFNLLSQDSPAGLISGVNYFTSDGTQLVAYDPTGSSNGGTTQESYTWQGITYSNLAPGTYTFTYIPLGSTESSYPNGTPTQDWVPMDNVILSLGVTITQNDLDGDANNNGILDVNEVAVGEASGGPTVVSQGSSQVIGYIATTGGVIQVVQRTQTDTTWDNMSDGTTANTQTSSTTLTPFEGRVDQAATAQDVVGSTLRTLDFNNIQGIRMNSKYNNGMGGSTTGVVVGGEKELENGVTISGGFTRLGTGLTGNDDSVDAETTAFAAGVEKNSVKLEVRRAMTDYEVTRTIGDFANASETSGAETSVRLSYSPDTGKINPVFGYTRGKRTMDGYTETGSSQTARTVDATSDMYGYGTVGLRGDLGLVDFTALHHTDGVNDISLGLEKDTGDITWRVEGTRSMTDLGNTNAISAGLVIKF